MKRSTTSSIISGCLLLLALLAGASAPAQSLPGLEPRAFDVPEGMFPAENPSGSADDLPPAPEHARPVPGHGVFTPVDVRRWLAARGVPLDAGELALYDRKHALLFLRALPPRTIAVEALVNSAWTVSDFTPAFRLEFTVSEVSPAGARSMLVRRILRCCPSGRRFLFDRSLRGEVVEMEEIEATYPDGSGSVDLNLALEYLIRGQRLSCALQTQLSEGKAASTMVYAAPLREKDTRAEIWVTLIHDTPRHVPAADLDWRARQIDAALRAPGDTTPASGVFYFPALESDLSSRTGDWSSLSLPESPLRVPALGNALMLDIAGALMKGGMKLEPGETALYASDPGLLYARARPEVLAALEEEFPAHESLRGYNLRLKLEKESDAGWRALPPSRLFRLPGEWHFPRPSDGTESIRASMAEAGKNEPQVLALDFSNLHLGSGESWRYYNDIVSRRNKEPVVIVEGASADTGMQNRRLLVSVEPALSRWEAVVQSPGRREQLIRDIDGTRKK